MSTQRDFVRKAHSDFIRNRNNLQGPRGPPTDGGTGKGKALGAMGSLSAAQGEPTVHGCWAAGAAVWEGRKAVFQGDGNMGHPGSLQIDPLKWVPLVVSVWAALPALPAAPGQLPGPQEALPSPRSSSQGPARQVQLWGCVPAQMRSRDGSCQQQSLSHTPHLVLNAWGKEQVVLNAKPLIPRVFLSVLGRRQGP